MITARVPVPYRRPTRTINKEVIMIATLRRFARWFVSHPAPINSKWS